MIQRVAQVMKKYIREIDLPIKLAGSEFLLAVEVTDKNDLENIRLRLSESLNSDSKMIEIYIQQIKFLETAAELEVSPQKKESYLQKIKEVQKMLKGPLVTTQGLFIADQQSYKSLTTALESMEKPNP